MKYQTFAHQINNAKVLLDGLKTYGETMAVWGITTEFLERYNSLYNQANQQEEERNNLKATSLEATSRQTQTMAELNQCSGTVKKLVRLALPETAWAAFGFRAGEYAAKKSGSTEENQADQKDQETAAS